MQEEPHKGFPGKQAPAEGACVLHTDCKAGEGCLSTKGTNNTGGCP